MPLDLIRNTRYEVDYLEIKEYISKQISPLFEQQYIKEQFLMQWISLLQGLDKRKVNYCWEGDLIKDQEMFQYTQYIENSTILFHFDISCAISYLKAYMSNYADEDIILFKPQSGPKFCWSKPDDFRTDFPIINPSPIITVPLPSDLSRRLVIDGNHRIAKYVDDDKPRISTLKLSLPDIFIFNKLLISRYDFAFYFSFVILAI